MENTLPLAQNDTFIYRVNRIPPRLMSLNRNDAATVWGQANLLTAFSYPWDDGRPLPTRFRALWDGDWFYFRYEAQDGNISEKADPSRPVLESDRVEIFFKINDELNPYYSLEMDALGRVFSSKNIFYRDIDGSWEWPTGHFGVFSSIYESGYTVEGKISLSSLRELDLLQENVLKAGLFRGEYFYAENVVQKIKWVSWVKPVSETPDFHIASAFGVLELMG